MNKLESAYADHLATRRAVGVVVSFEFEAIKLRLADRTWYTPDFCVVTPDHVEFHEVKGFWEDDARVKWKVAAERNPWARWMAFTLVNGTWAGEEYGK
jgi:hypothetical protein